MTSFSTEEFLTVADIAGRLRLTEQTVRNWIDEGKLPAFRIGRRLRIARSDFDRLVDGGYSRAARSSSEDERAAQAFWGRLPRVGRRYPGAVGPGRSPALRTRPFRDRPTHGGSLAESRSAHVSETSSSTCASHRTGGAGIFGVAEWVRIGSS